MLGWERATALRAQGERAINEYQIGHQMSRDMSFQQCGMCRPACAYMQTDPGLCYSLEYSMIAKLTEQYLEFLSLKGDCTGRSESTPVTCWNSHVAAQISKELRQF